MTAARTTCPVCGDKDNEGGFCMNTGCARAREQAAGALHKMRSAASTWARVQARRRTVCVYCGTRIPGALTKAERRHKHRFSPEQILSARFTCMRHRDLPLSDPHYESLFGGRRVG